MLIRNRYYKLGYVATKGAKITKEERSGGKGWAKTVMGTGYALLFSLCVLNVMVSLSNYEYYQQYIACTFSHGLTIRS